MSNSMILRFTMGSRKGEKLNLQQGGVVGRDPGCLIHLADRFISRHHAALVRNGDRWMIQNLNPGNSTLVDGVCLKDAVPFVLKDTGTIAFAGNNGVVCSYQTKAEKTSTSPVFVSPSDKAIQDQQEAITVTGKKPKSSVREHTNPQGENSSKDRPNSGTAKASKNAIPIDVKPINSPSADTKRACSPAIDRAKTEQIQSLESQLTAMRSRLLILQQQSDTNSNQESPSRNSEAQNFCIRQALQFLKQLGRQLEQLNLQCKRHNLPTELVQGLENSSLSLCDLRSTLQSACE